jgi:catechol 2,3-dioxygenase-like lactoylglutathione lyase family enzyme
MIKTVWCVTFYVSDLKKAAEFCKDTLGLERKYEFPSYAGLECGGVEIGLIPKTKETQTANMASPSVEFLVDDADKVCSGLKKKGVKFIKELHDEPCGGKQATFTDSDGNVLEVAQISWGEYSVCLHKVPRRKREQS